MPHLLCVLLTSLAAADPTPAPTPTALDTALIELRIDRRDLAPDPLKLATSPMAAHRPPTLTSILSDPIASPYRTSMQYNSMVNRKDSVHRLALTVAGMQGIEVARGYFGSPFNVIDARLLKATDPMEGALGDLARAHDWPTPPPVPKAEELPAPLRLEVARLLAVMANAEGFRERAFRKLPPEATPTLLLRQVLGKADPGEGPDYRLLLDEVEWEALAVAELDMVAAVEDFENFVNETKSLPRASWRLDTPQGLIAVDTTGTANEWKTPAILLLIDAGGDDSYRSMGGADSVRAGLSVLIDTAGNDTYTMGLPNGPDGAALGASVLWDMAGDDHYRSSELAQASAVFGASVVIDRSGNDLYEARGFAQASAVGGWAMLADFTGTDKYEALTNSQAYGGPGGVGVLLDFDGDDTYTLANEPLSFPSPQSPKHNISMGQGAGCGVRGELGDGRSAPGGVGMLIDVAGDDTYMGQVFCQGTGYLDGAGVLIDGGGADKYHGVWYAQGAAAHRATGALLDLGEGNDEFVADLYTSMATGHDYSVGVLINEAGDDRYELKGGGGLGAGIENGTGIFIDVTGNDHYAIPPKVRSAFGSAEVTNWGSMRETQRCLGLFFDLGGEDHYAGGKTGAAEGKTWFWERKFPDLMLASESGRGTDTTATSFLTLKPKTPPGDQEAKTLRETLRQRRAYRVLAVNLPKKPET